MFYSCIGNYSSVFCILYIGYYINLLEIKIKTVIHKFLVDVRYTIRSPIRKAFRLTAERKVSSQPLACNFRACLGGRELLLSTSCPSQGSLHPVTDRDEGTEVWFFWPRRGSSDGQHSPDSYPPGWPRLFLSLHYCWSMLPLKAYTTNSSSNWEIFKNANSQPTSELPSQIFWEWVSEISRWFWWMLKSENCSQSFLSLPLPTFNL